MGIKERDGENSNLSVGCGEDGGGRERVPMMWWGGIQRPEKAECYVWHLNWAQKNSHTRAHVSREGIVDKDCVICVRVRKQLELVEDIMPGGWQCLKWFNS